MLVQVTLPSGHFSVVGVVAVPSEPSLPAVPRLLPSSSLAGLPGPLDLEGRAGAGGGLDQKAVESLALLTVPSWGGGGGDVIVSVVCILVVGIFFFFFLMFY